MLRGGGGVGQGAKRKVLVDSQIIKASRLIEGKEGFKMSLRKNG